LQSGDCPVKPGENDFRQRYAELSDEGLLSIDPAELVDAARQCYEGELRTRGLAPASYAAGEDDGELSEAIEDTLIPAATFLFPDEAEAARGLMCSAGILCYLENRHTLNAVWGWSYFLGGLRLMVPASDLEAAHELLHQMHSEQEAAPEIQTEAWSETTGGNPVTTRGYRRGGRRARAVLAVAILFTPAVEVLRLLYV
jgi:hypothetical protein